MKSNTLGIILIVLLYISNSSIGYGQNYIQTTNGVKIWKPSQKNYDINISNAPASEDDINYIVKYKGGVQDGMAHGQGKASFFFRDECCMRYVGMFKNGMPNGYGRVDYPNTKKSFKEYYYEGQFIDGLYDGEGLIYFLSNMRKGSMFSYKGTFKKGKLDGKAQYQNNSGFGDPTITYDGEWKDGLRSGYGKYVGELINNKKTILSTNDSYEGEWQNDIPNGKGKYVFADKYTYLGDVKMAEVTGKGTITWPNGEKYEGEVLNGNRHGQGKFFSSNGKIIYDGEWKNNVKSGMGKIYDSNNNAQDGYFLNNRLIANSRPILTRKDSIPQLNKNIYKNIRYVDVYSDHEMKKGTDCARCGKHPYNCKCESPYQRQHEYNPGFVQIANNGTAVILGDRQLYDLNEQKGYSNLGYYNYCNNTQTLGIYFDREKKTCTIYDYLNKKTHSRIKDLKWSMVGITGDGNFIIVNDGGAHCLVNPETGNTAFKVGNEYKDMFVTPDYKYIYTIKFFYESGQRATVAIYDFTTGEILDNMQFEVPYEDHYNMYYIDETKVYITVLGGFDVSNGKLKQIQLTAPEKDQYSKFTYNVWINKNNTQNIRITNLVDDQHTYELSPFTDIKRGYRDTITTYLNKKIVDIHHSEHSFNFNNEYLNTIYKNGEENPNIGKITVDTMMFLGYSKSLNGDYRNFCRIINLKNMDKPNLNTYYKDIAPWHTQKFNDYMLKVKGIDDMLYASYYKFKNAITYESFFYVAPNNSRNIIDWANSGSADEMKQYEKYNIFVGGTVHNNSDTTYNVNVDVEIFTRTTATAFWVFSDTDKNSTKLANKLIVPPGMSVPFLVCLENLRSGYYLKSSGTGSSTIIDDPSNAIYISEYKGVISPQTIENQKKLIDDFIANKNLSNNKSFSICPGQSELNVYFISKNDYMDLDFTIIDNQGTIDKLKSTKTYRGNKCQFCVYPEKKYVISILEKKYYPVLKDGVNQMFINENGDVTYEYNKW